MNNTMFKGQFFLFGAILLVVLFALGLPLAIPVFQNPSQDLPFLSANIVREYPYALNLGLNQSDGIGTLVNFTDFLNSTLNGHGVNFSALWLVAANRSADTNITVGNFLGSAATVTLTVAGTSRQLALAQGATGEALFLAPGTAFNLTIAFRGRQSTVEFVRDKVSLFVFTHLARGTDIVREEIAA